MNSRANFVYGYYGTMFPVMHTVFDLRLWYIGLDKHLCVRACSIHFASSFLWILLYIDTHRNNHHPSQISKILITRELEIQVNLRSNTSYRKSYVYYSIDYLHWLHKVNLGDIDQYPDQNEDSK